MQKRILLVDDEASIRRSLSMGLAQQGYDVELCENGLDALKKIETYNSNNISFDSILLDINLPDIDGIKIGQVIKEKYPDQVLIFISGYANSANMDDMKNMEYTAFVAKPFAATEFTTKYEEIMSTMVVPEKEVKQSKSTIESKYALIKIDKNADFFEVSRNLYFMDNVVYCDAIKGEYDMIMLTHSEAGTKSAIENIEGVASVEYLEIEKVVLDEQTLNVMQSLEDISSDGEKDAEKGRNLAQKACSYVLMEIEREKLDQLYPVLKLHDNVVYCDFARGKYNMVLFVYGSYFSEIDKFIQNTLTKMDGIVKIKEFPIVNLFDM